MSSSSWNVNRVRSLLVLALIAALGAACVIVPAMGITPRMSAPLFPLLRTAIEKMTWVPIAALGVLGLACGIFTYHKPVVIGAASVAVLPLAAFAEMIADPTSHNMIPFELAMYAAMGLPALLMAFLARWMRRGNRVAPAA